MKKFISVLTALALVCMACTTVMAAAISSPMKVVIPEEGTVTTVDGETINVNNPEEMKKYLEVQDTDKSAEEVSGYSPLTVFDVKFHGITSAETILYVPGVKKGDKIIVRMYANGKWIDVEAEVIEDNKVKVKLLQEGTLEILKASSNNGGNNGGNGNGTDKPGNNTDNSGNNTNGNNGTNGSGSAHGSNTSAKSPKTGETNALPAAYAVFAGCALAAGTAGMKLRKKAQ